MSDLADAVETINSSKTPDVAAGSYVLSKLATVTMMYCDPWKMGAFTKDVLEELKQNGAEFDLEGAARCVANHTSGMAYRAQRAKYT